MIDKALTFIQQELDNFLSAQFQANENFAVLSNLTNMDGTCAINIDHKIVLSLFNVEKESAPTSLHPASPATDKVTILANRASHFTVYFLVSAPGGAAAYTNALSLLSSALAFFEAKPVFDASSSPAFPPGLARLTIDVMNLSLAEWHDVWRVMSTPYVPSAAYRMRILNS